MSGIASHILTKSGKLKALASIRIDNHFITLARWLFVEIAVQQFGCSGQIQVLSELRRILAAAQPER